MEDPASQGPNGDRGALHQAFDSLGRVLGDPPRAALLAATVAAVVFAGSLVNSFAYDDTSVVAGDFALHSLATLPGRLAQPYWPTSFGAQIGNWRPATTALFGLTWVASGGSPTAFHLVDVALHAIAAALVVLVLAELMSARAAALGGLLFAVHPVHVEAVANVVGTAEPFSAIFLLAAALLHLRGRERYGLLRAFGVTLLYEMAILAKEGAVVLPLLLLLLDASRTELDARGLRRYVRDRGPIYLLLAAILGVILIGRDGVLGSALAAPAPPGAEILRDIPRIWTLAQVWPHYLRLLVFPLDLAADYAPALIRIAFGWTLPGILGVVTVLGLLITAWVAWRRGVALAPGRGSVRIVGVGILWAGAALLPVANVFFLSNILLAERTLYVASIGAAAVGGWVLVRLHRERPRVAVLAAAVLTLAFAARSAVRVRVWHDTRTVMSTLLDRHPLAGRGWAWYAGQLADRGKNREARRAYMVAVGLLNSDYQVCTEAASHLLAMGRLPTARFLLKRAWREHPGWSTAPGLLAAVDLGEHRYVEAEAAARAGTILSPSNPSMYHLLALALSALGRPSEAVRARATALREGFARPQRLWVLQARDLASMGDTTAALAALDSAGRTPLSAEEHEELRTLRRDLRATGRR